MYNAPGKATVIVDGQYGSTGKGAVAGFLARSTEFDFVVSNSGSQAGHTYRDGNTTIVTRHLPVAGIVNNQCSIFLSSSCVIDLEVLDQEIDEYGLHRRRIYIHPNAAIIDPFHKMYEEKELGPAIGSTAKGNGAALAQKILRRARLAKDVPEIGHMIGRLPLNEHLQRGARVLVEGAQGFSLSLDERFYPHCTSRNCWVGQALSDAWIHPSFLGTTIMVIRTHPIRVAGNSGGWYPDQVETSWKELNRPEEITTVTKRVRRVASFSVEQLRDAARANRPDVLAVSHLDYVDPGLQYHFMSSCLRICYEATGKLPQPLYGLGADVRDWSFIHDYSGEN